MKKTTNQQSELMVKMLKVVSQRTIDNPITGAEIAELIGCDWRSVADCVEMARFARFKIGSSKTKPMGYFLARCPEELIGTVHRMKKTCLVQLAQLKKMLTWKESEPNLWEGATMEEVDRAIAEFYNVMENPEAQSGLGQTA